MIKEALFNILPSMEGRLFLDLFAGTGNIGLEALSRRAAKTVFIEPNPLLVDTIKDNLNVCGFDDKYEIISAPVERGVKHLSKRKERFDIIFADPPYEKGLIKETLYLLGDGDLISRDGMVIIQHSSREKLEWGAGNFVLTDQRKYSYTIISFLKMHSEHSERI